MVLASDRGAAGPAPASATAAASATPARARARASPRARRGPAARPGGCRRRRPARCGGASPYAAGAPALGWPGTVRRTPSPAGPCWRDTWRPQTSSCEPPSPGLPPAKGPGGSRSPTSSCRTPSASPAARAPGPGARPRTRRSGTGAARQCRGRTASESRRARAGRKRIGSPCKSKRQIPSAATWLLGRRCRSVHLQQGLPQRGAAAKT
mmetsp:Transcript_119594/g.381625  ORF Transcript_119594/g.381625 Transcript_119594/m.381625 type:complete len:209 (+) Transcript_119594:411-1037(+)